ncbi:hypothetical protein SAPIO_CDS8246 [Scedosporium apiospermum]|uniref:Transcription factor domain-containing protein n=1 Tax=Pseudallescheria apiosperma TaxID=563466 RepID=A0A084FZ77_PSEDA|nr:uncharacterized protein SAPIO_CDS8246 [Scedosporium apiospermum]KEZ40389.1 hypothetical protein SAPIO_CDS8246 [Scedosporium apiospermum]
MKFINTTLERPYRSGATDVDGPVRSTPGASDSASTPAPPDTTQEGDRGLFGPLSPTQPRAIANELNSHSGDALSSPGNDSRFVGNLNPESTFLADGPRTGEGYTRSDPIGVWVSRRGPSGGAPSLGTPATSRDLLPLRSLLPGHSMDNFLKLVPPGSHYEGLKAIYLRDIHRMFPAMDLTILERSESIVSQTLSKQAICLAAGAHPDAKAFLIIGSESGNPMSYSDFAHQISSAMRGILNAGLIVDRIQLIPILVILSLYTYSSEDRHLSAELAALAVSHTHTVGLHHQTPGTRSENSAYLATLFCCVWALDRLNAAFNGRPVMMHERDFGRDLQACISQQESCFRLLLENISLLDRAIQLYRPPALGLPNELVQKLPTFESLVEKAEAIAIDTRVLATLELLYHAIVILSCKAPTTSLPSSSSSSSYMKTCQRLSSVSITTIAEDMGGLLPRFTFLPPDSAGGVPEPQGPHAATSTPGLGTPHPAEPHSRALGSSGQGDTSASYESLIPPPPDTSFPGGLARIDLFEYLNADFDLGAIDAVLGDTTGDILDNCTRMLPTSQKSSGLIIYIVFPKVDPSIPECL